MGYIIERITETGRLSLKLGLSLACNQEGKTRNALLIFESIYAEAISTMAF